VKGSDFKNLFWDLIRPLHSPFTRAARRRLGRDYARHPEMELPASYEAVQLEVERRLHLYLHRDPADVRQVVIVGANDGSEVPRLRHSYPDCRFLCFEPSPKWFRILSDRFSSLDYVDSRQLALSNAPGSATFHELPLAGNGSLLQPDQRLWQQLNAADQSQVSSFEVKVSTLDEEAANLAMIDLLWVDVQGAEANVLQGGAASLGRTDAIFLEVALVQSPYQGARLMPDLSRMLAEHGFTLVSLGLDPANYTGNALWVKDLAPRMGLSSL
jgi:FkbM family methyltransferase